MGLDYETTPYQYLNRFALCDKFFRGDLKWEGVISSDGHLRTVTSQPFYRGEPPSVAEFEDKLSSLGFVARKIFGLPDHTIWYRKQDGVILGDAKPANFVKTVAGLVHPIDVIAEQSTKAQRVKYGLSEPDAEAQSML